MLLNQEGNEFNFQRHCEYTLDLLCPSLDFSCWLRTGDLGIEDACNEFGLLYPLVALLLFWNMIIYAYLLFLESASSYNS